MTVAFVFPGQGSQSQGMMMSLAAEFDQVRSTFDSASEVLGYDLWEVCQHGPADRLNSTEVTQPAMLTAGVATWRCWIETVGHTVPAAMAGHSLGEYTALVCAGSLDFADAVGLVQFRGQAMQQAVPAGSGAMAAVLGLDDAVVEQVCQECSNAEQSVEAVNYNSPGQVVIAGHKKAVEQAIDIVKSKGARRALLLPVSVPSHSRLMKPAAQKMTPKLAATVFKPVATTAVYTVGLRKHSQPDDIRSSLVEQLYSPVRWSETIAAMINDQKVSQIIECGPGKVLTGLNKRITRGSDVAVHALHDAAAITDTARAIAGEIR